MNNVFKDKLKNLKKNFKSNAKEAIYNWLDENWTNDGYELMKRPFGI